MVACELSCCYLAQHSPIHIRAQYFALDAGGLLNVRALVSRDSALLPIGKGLLCYAKTQGD